MAEIFFEENSVPAFYIQNHAVLSLFSHGKTNGLVFDAGVDVSHVVPIYEAYSVKPAMANLDFGGADLTEWMKDLLTEINFYFSSIPERQIVKDIKIKKSYIALDYEEELSIYENGDSKDAQYELPDGQIINLGSQQIRCPEVFFKPQMIGKDCEGVH